MHLNALALVEKEYEDLVSLTRASFPFTRASHLPYRRKVVVRIYSCGSGRLLLSVKLVKTSVFDFLTANIKPRLSLIESKGLCRSRLEKFEVKDAHQISATAFDNRIIRHVTTHPDLSPRKFLN